MVLKLLAALALATGVAGPGLAQDDLVAAGEKVFNRCKACHQVGADAKNRVGPALTGVIGRQAGTVADFKYSDAMIEAGKGGLVWDAASLDAYLENPREHVKGTKMAFAGLKKEEDRHAVIAYIEANGGGGS